MNSIDNILNLDSKEKLNIIKKLFLSLEPVDKIGFIQDMVQNIKLESEINPALSKYGRRIEEGYVLILKNMIYELKNNYNEHRHLQICLMIEGAPLFNIIIPKEVKENYVKIIS